ncbi:MAG TPA: glycosyltransferase [Thermoanaerobaculia bacterium]
MHDPIDLPAAGPPRVSVIIPAAGDAGLLRACLRSLARHGPAAIPFETIVVLDGTGKPAALPEAAAPATCAWCARRSTSGWRAPATPPAP